MIIIHLFGVLLGMTLGLLPIDVICALCLGQLVNLGTSEASEKLFGKSVADRLAFVALMILERF